MLEDYTKVVIQRDANDRYWVCPVCGEINYLCPADESGMKDDCILCDETVILMEE